MGVSYSAQVVCGFDFEMAKFVKSVTKYNEDTGEPYKVDQCSHYMAKAGPEGEVVVEDNVDDPSYWEETEHEGMKVHSSGYCGEGVKIFGVEVVRVGEYGDYEGLDTEIPEEVEAFAEKHSIEPSFHLLMSCG